MLGQDEVWTNVVCWAGVNWIWWVQGIDLSTIFRDLFTFSAWFSSRVLSQKKKSF
jgi:hypothetical protein